MSWWNELRLEQLDEAQWEALCDGCAKCCLHKLQDEQTDEIYFTKVRCQYLSESTCNCSCYAQRKIKVPNCIDLKEWNVAELNFLPATCAYRLRSLGEPLPAWHYLETGDKNSVHQAGISIRGRSISDEFVHPEGYDEHIITWVE